MRYSDSDTGFTLIEVLVALALVTLIFTVLLVSVSTGLGKVREVERETAALVWVQAALDAAMVIGVGALPSAGRFDASRTLAGLPPLPPGLGRAELVVRQMSPRPVLKEVTVSIYRHTSGGAPLFSLSTIVGQRSGP